jgi:subtilisin family serine protease
MNKKLLLSLCVFSTTAFANQAKYVPGEIIVKFKSGSEKAFFNSVGVRQIGVNLKRDLKLNLDQLSVLKIDQNKNKMSMDETLRSLRSNPNVVYAEPNFIYSVNPIRGQAFTMKKVQTSPFADASVATPNDPRFQELWGLRNTGSNEPKGSAGVEGVDVNAVSAWNITSGAKNIKIAVIDTGVDYNHPDLKQNTWTNLAELNGKPGVDDDGNGFVDDIHGYDFANHDGDPMDGHGHGTHCSGTIGALHNNQTGVAGVMSDVTIVPIKFLGDDGSGTLESAIEAIDYATSLNVDLMSNSWGGGGFSQALFDAIKRASDKGIIFSAAAGNESSNNDTTPAYPASYKIPNVVSVAAITAQNGLAYFSCYGRNSVHIAAPGHNILSTVSGGKYEIMSGTSMATPHVSGVLGLLLSKEGRMPHDTMKERLMMTSVPVAALRGKTTTAGRVDAYNLLTDVRPERSGPRSDLWRTEALSSAFESDHPYKENSALKRTISVPGAKYIRVKVAKYDLESGYDYVRLSDGKGTAVEKISGTGTDYVSEYVEGDTVVLDFISDRSINKWGFKITEIEVQ